MKGSAIKASKLRVFVGLKLSEDGIQATQKAQDLLRRKKLFAGRWTKPENLHLTLKFLGEINHDFLSLIKHSLKSIKIPSFKASIGEIGVFSTTQSIRIIWIHILGKGILDLQRQVDTVLINHLEPEKRFMSHLTIARVKFVSDRIRLIKEIRNIQTEPIDFMVKEFSLIKSELTPDGPIYTPLQTYHLEDSH